MLRSLVVFSMLGASAVQAQVRYTIEPTTSLAWWQIDPNYGHLWATTCPEDPSWQAGEARSGTARINVSTRKETVATAYHDERIPLYPREEVNAVCRPAVRGELATGDLTTFRDLNGTIAVRADSFFTGLEFRDKFARGSVFETGKHPEVRFHIDSLAEVVPGDTIVGFAVGTFEMRGVRQPMRVPVKAWREGELLRARAQLKIPARALTHEFGMSRLALGMGVVMGRWETVYAGVDVLLRAVTSEAERVPVPATEFGR